MAGTRITASQALALCLALEDADPDGADAHLAELADRVYAAGINGRSITLSAADGAYLVASIEADRAEWPAALWRSLDTALARLEGT